jgi:hypothetical protein
MSRMTRWGLLGLLTLSISGAVAVPAQAGSLDIGANPAILVGHNEVGKGIALSLTFTKTDAQLGFALCTTASYEGTVQQLPQQPTQNAAEATITPTYGKTQTGLNECVVGNLGEAQIKMNGCKYTLTGTGQAANTFQVDIAGCTAGKQIEIKATGCTLHIGEHSGLSHVVAANVAGGQEITLQVKMSPIKILQTGAACPDGNNHQSTDGLLQGNILVKAFKDAGNTTVTKHGHQYQEGVRGEQVSLTST